MIDYKDLADAYDAAWADADNEPNLCVLSLRKAAMWMSLQTGKTVEECRQHLLGHAVPFTDADGEEYRLIRVDVGGTWEPTDTNPKGE